MIRLKWNNSNYFKGIKFLRSLHLRNFDTFAEVLEAEGWNKKNKNQLRNNNDFYVWEISQGQRFVSNKDCISLFKKKKKNFAD